jgi:hypothetical protein
MKLQLQKEISTLINFWIISLEKIAKKVSKKKIFLESHDNSNPSAIFILFLITTCVYPLIRDLTSNIEYN